MNTIKFGSLSTLLVASVFASSVSAGSIDLGDAAHYNVFLKENFSANSGDVEGRLAAGGNVDISSYSVNVKHGSQLYSDTNEYPALVSGGDLTFSNGNIAGNVYVGGNYYGSPSGTITNGTLSQSGGSPIDFNETFNSLTQLSTNLSQLDENGVAEDLWSTQYLRGAGVNGQADDLHIFSMDASDMLFSDYQLSGVDQGDIVIFNVAGENISTSSGNFQGSDFSLGNVANNILFNFYEAKTLDINAVLYGSILAPTADITTTWGLIEGQVIANSWTGNAQVNDRSFVGMQVQVSEPSSFGLLSLGALLLVGVRRTISRQV